MQQFLLLYDSLDGCLSSWTLFLGFGHFWEASEDTEDVFSRWGQGKGSSSSLWQTPPAVLEQRVPQQWGQAPSGPCWMRALQEEFLQPWHKQPVDAAGGTAVHAEGHKEEASKLSLSSMHILRDGGHKAQDPSATEGALTAVCCHTLVPGWRTQLSESIGPHTLQSSLDYFEWSWWQGEAPEDWKRANITSIFTKEGAGNYRPIGLTSIPGNVKEETFLETISKHMEDKQVIGIVCMDLWKGNFSWTNTLLSTMMWLARWMRGEQWMSTLALAKPLTLSLIILSCQLHRQADKVQVRWVDGEVDWKTGSRGLSFVAQCPAGDESLVVYPRVTTRASTAQCPHWQPGQWRGM